MIFPPFSFSTTLLSTLSYVYAASSSHVDLGSASNFAIIAATTITNTGSLTTVVGDMAVYPGSAITGFSSGQQIGTSYLADTTATQAENDAHKAYLFLQAQTCERDLTGQDLSTLTLTSGVYCFASSSGLSGILTLDAQNDPAAQFIFQIGSTLTIAAAAQVLLINSAQACHVFFQVGTSASLGAGASINGNILAETGITLGASTIETGLLASLSASVTLIDNTVNAESICNQARLSSSSSSTTSPSSSLSLSFSSTMFLSLDTSSISTVPSTLLSSIVSTSLLYSRLSASPSSTPLHVSTSDTFSTSTVSLTFSSSIESADLPSSLSSVLLSSALLPMSSSYSAPYQSSNNSNAFSSFSTESSIFENSRTNRIPTITVSEAVSSSISTTRISVTGSNSLFTTTPEFWSTTGMYPTPGFPSSTDFIMTTPTVLLITSGTNSSPCTFPQVARTVICSYVTELLSVPTSSSHFGTQQLAPSMSLTTNTFGPSSPSTLSLTAPSLPSARSRASTMEVESMLVITTFGIILASMYF